MVCTLIDHRNHDVKMLKTLQWNHPPVACASTCVLNILSSFLWSIRVQIKGNCCLFVKYSLNICYHKTIHIHVTHKWNCQSLAQHYNYWLESAVPSGPEIKRLFSLPSFLLHFTVALCGILFIFDSLFIGLFLSGFMLIFQLVLLVL